MEPRHYDTEVKAKKPFIQYHIQGADNPRFKGKAISSAGQFEKPTVVVTDSVVEPSITVGTSIGTTTMPPSSFGSHAYARLSVPLLVHVLNLLIPILRSESSRNW